MKRLLILSDLHVGRDCKIITGFKDLRPNPEFDQAFIDLLEHYTADQEGEWRLILGGDFIDFMEVVVAPGHQGRVRVSFEVTDEEREFGFGSEPERVIVKLEHAMQYHARFFDALAAFIRKGGELVIVRGNHDVELYWSKVKRVLRRKLADIAFRDAQLDVDDAIDLRNAFQERVDFQPWFYYEAGRIWFEHGNQYDPYCSFDHWLHPISPTNPKRIDTPVSLFAMRYFVNLITDYSAHDADIWGWPEYIRWIRKQGIGGNLYLARMGVGAIFRIIQYTLRWSIGSVGAFKKEHSRKLRELSESSGIALGRLKEIASLRAAPVSRNLPELMRLLFLDRILLVVGTLFAAGLLLLGVETTWVELLGIVLVAILAARVNALMVPRRYLLPGPKQAGVAKRISEVLGVPLVAMGHSHVRRVVDLGPGRLYMNTGCWLPPLEGRDHVDPHEPCTCKLSHITVEADGKPELRVFCKARKTVRLTDVDEMGTAADGGPQSLGDGTAPHSVAG